MGAWLGDTPAVLTSILISPYFCPSSISARMDSRLDKSICRGVTSNPAPFIVWATASAFASF